MKKKGVHRKPEKIFELNEADDRLYDIFSHHGFKEYPHPKRRQLAQFYRLLMTHQLTDNVTRLIKFRDVAIKHFIDSLMVPRLVRLRFPLLDMGTGPGFPGIPLKIEFPREKIVLVEGVRRRVEFLKAVRSAMNLENLDVIGRKVDPTFVYPVSGVITRAVEEIPLTLYNISQCLQVGGEVYLMKGPNVDAEIKAAEREWSKYFQLVKNIDYSLPATPNERRLVVYRKTKTPELETECD